MYHITNRSLHALAVLATRRGLIRAFQRAGDHAFFFCGPCRKCLPQDVAHAYLRMLVQPGTHTAPPALHLRTLHPDDETLAFLCRAARRFDLILDAVLDADNRQVTIHLPSFSSTLTYDEAAAYLADCVHTVLQHINEHTAGATRQQPHVDGTLRYLSRRRN